MVMVGQHARSSPEKVYLSDVEIHRQSPIASAEDLRARVLFHVLLSDTLLVGDSQSLNTPSSVLWCRLTKPAVKP
ncbi:hypothetical protein [Streptomyces xinghaiensis]|uniref:hypothetical protein n=1 Tax=Streptomyces xinghaiensis TaxID=1038928 RepID=UPI000BAEA833|nr:hypothetical protein [Streptomyces xinghaiensis]